MVDLASLRQRARAAGIAPGIVARAEMARMAHRAEYEAWRAGGGPRHGSGQMWLRPPPAAKLVDPTPINFEGVDRWVVAICKPSMAMSVSEDLNAIGFRSYCPLGRRIVFRGRAAGSRKRRIHQWAIFGRYLFVGELGEPLATYIHEGIVDVIGDSVGAWPLNPLVLKAINDAELAGQWDTTKTPEWEAKFKMGDYVKVGENNPFCGFEGFVLSCSKAGINVELDVFSRKTKVSVQSAKLVAEAV